MVKLIVRAACILIKEKKNSPPLLALVASKLIYFL